MVPLKAQLIPYNLSPLYQNAKKVTFQLPQLI